MLLFADDIALFTTDKYSLQTQLNNVYEYSTKWGLTINVNKTKICVFEKRKQLHNMEWFINNQKVEEVDYFYYLGVKFVKTGNLRFAVKALHDQASRAMNNLLLLFKKLSFDVKTKLSLFDKLISPILLYGSELWGIFNFDDVNRLHIKFCKMILGVNKNTMNQAALGELGRLPLSIIAICRSLRYWIKIRNCNIQSLKDAFYSQCNNNIPISNKSWAFKIKQQLDNLGFSDLWFNEHVNIAHYHLIKQRVTDHYIQKWQSDVNSSSRLTYYSKFKTSFELESYLINIKNDTLRKQLSKFRLSSHNLAVETGRHNSIDINNRICLFCNQNQIESEYHMLLICPKYRTLRQTYLSRHINFPTVNKFISIMSSNSPFIQLSVAKFLKYAFNERKLPE